MVPAAMSSSPVALSGFMPGSAHTNIPAVQMPRHIRPAMFAPMLDLSRLQNIKNETHAAAVRTAGNGLPI
jgi:hypothetical protein